MSINHNNIDQWLFNYYEGNLTPSEISKLEGFLKAYPEYHEDADAWKNSFVEEPIPAFDSSVLVKDVKSGSERKRYALAALALLLVGSVSTYFIMNPSKSLNESDNSFKASTNFSNSNTTNHSIYNSTNQTESKSNDKSEKVQDHAMPVVIVVNNFIPVQSSSIANGEITNVTNNRSSLVNNAPGVLPSTPISTKSNSGINNEIINEENINGEISSNSNSSIQNGVLSGEAFASDISINGLNQTVSSSVIESNLINNELTVINEEQVKEFSLVEVAEENINLTKEKIETNTKVVNVTSILNPDLLAKNNSGETGISKQDELVSKNDKIKISTAKGVKMTNLKNVIVIQPAIFDFQNNASFITQNYVLDGYAGANFSQIGTKEIKTSYIAGISHTMRKIKTTLNGYTEYSNSTFGSSAGLVIQGATNFKFDRHQNLIPSVTLSYNRFGFNNQNTLSSYFVSDLTGLNEQHEYKTSNQLNLNTGVLYHHKKFYASLALNGLLQPKFTYTQNDRELSNTNSASVNLVGGTEFVSRKRPELSFSPQIAMQVRNVDARFTTGGYMRYRSFFAGAGVDTKGAITTMAGINHRMITVQYRFVYDKLDETNGFLNAHMLSARINMKGLMKKQKAILDSER